MTAVAKDAKSEAMFFNCCSFPQEDLIRLAEGTKAERNASLVSVSNITKEDVLRSEPMTIIEEVVTMLFLMIGVPNGVFSIPVLTFLIGKFFIGSVTTAFLVLGVLLIPLIIMPQRFIPTSLHSWMAIQVMKYFSFRIVSLEQSPQRDSSVTDRTSPLCRPQILVAPPHGVFPYGNLLAMLAWPSFTGNHFLGLAANSALRVPIFKQILCRIGVIDASRESARRALENYPHTIGISTGGVAEVFETTSADECILLKERIGLIKLAIRTGGDLVPCYMFGNTKLLHCWAGDGIPGCRKGLEKVSRKLGFALILFYGRCGLPIPFRSAVLAVKGKAIPTHHIMCEEPTDAQITQIQTQLITDMQNLFDQHKHLFGWEDQKLVIK
jgi:1-acyl-sn-glycerol-3-phosphate acyltransferase